MFRYRKYQLAESLGEPDSPAHTPHASLGSLTGGDRGEGGASPPSRAVSTSTLISEVISLVKLRPRNRSGKHSRLRESVDTEALEKCKLQDDEGSGHQETSGGDSDEKASKSNR